MQLFRKFIQYMNPSLEPKVIRDMDRLSTRNIHIIALIVLALETCTMIVYLSSRLGRFDHDAVISMITVTYSIVLCATAWFVSGKMLEKDQLPHSRFFLFKIVFYLAFTAGAILVDFRYYRAGDQMLTFHAVSLVTVCFILFRPWVGTILITCSYTGLYLVLCAVDGAAGIELLNFIVLALAAMASNAVRYHSLIRVSSKAVQLKEDNTELEYLTRHDALTGLLNRLALEADAAKMDGRRMTAYMIDINYFKEINDQYGHLTGDEILRKTSGLLEHLYPGGHYYRYGGDEFLVLTHKPAEDNYGSDTFDFTYEKTGLKVLLSIGTAQGSPNNYEELFELIARADQSLYVTKERTHSAAFGGHERRKSRR